MIRTAALCFVWFVAGLIWGHLLIGCAAPEALDPGRFLPEDAGASDAPTCRGACYAACPRPFKSDVEANHCVWDCNYACYVGVP